MQRYPATPITFRLANLDDVDGLVDLVQSAYRGDESRRGWTTEADLLEGIRTDSQAVAALMTADRSVVLVGEGEAGLLACCHVEARGRGVAYFGMFAVRPDSQGGGIGRRVMEQAERLAVTRFGATMMTMTVIRQRPELIAWYRRLGYVPTGESRPFPYGDARFGLPTREDLEFVVLSRELLGAADPSGSAVEIIEPTECDEMRAFQVDATVDAK